MPPSSSSASLGSNPSTIMNELTAYERSCLYRIYRSNRRQLVDVRPTSEDLAAGAGGQSDGDGDNSSNKKKKKKKKGSKGGGDAPVVPEHSYRFVIRLHTFFVDFLMRASAAATAAASAPRARARRDDDGGPVSSNSSNQYLKHPSQSCLQELMGLAGLRRRANRRQSSSSELHGRGVRLLSPGRHTMHVSHSDFLEELDRYELQGQPKTSEYVQRHSFGAYLYHVPDDALASVASAIRLALWTLYMRQQPQQPTSDASTTSSTTNGSTAAAASSSPTAETAAVTAFLDHSQLHIRFVRVQPVVHMMDIKTSVVNKLLSVKGHVVKARPKQLRVATADFSCTSCGSILIHEFSEGRYSVPHKCVQHPQCRSTSFVMLRPTARYQNVQHVRIQETQEESFAHAGRTPRQLVVELSGDLVDACRPGDTVVVAAMVSAVNTSIQQGKYGKRAQETSTYSLYLRGHSVTTTSERSDRSGQQQHQRHQSSWHSQSSAMAYSSQQLQAITRLCHADHKYFGMLERRAFPFDLLVRSLCPSIIGHHQVKAGLLLCLLGGTPPLSASATTSSGSSASSAAAACSEHSMRSNSHVLIVGDPGMGKSQMLLAASQLASRSVYVGGNTSSTTGLTVTLTKEASGESGMEVGALVLSDQGICCIDEFDKMQKSHQDGLLEAMEQQQVSIAKAGVVASLPARCSVIAAANPKNGTYNMSKTVAENLNMAKPILSRFDLVFILRDRTDKEQDVLVSSNILNLYRRHPNPSATGSGNIDAVTATASMTPSAPSSTAPGRSTEAENHSNEERLPLKRRLAWVHEFQKEPLPASLVRDYIAYAREYCRPKLTPEAALVLKDYFMELRYPANHGGSGGGLGGRRKQETVPITTRQLEALIRLCQARAKACLREYCLREDALDVVELMGMSVEQVHSDESGCVDRGRGGAGGRSQRRLKKEFVEELHRLVGGEGAECGLDDLRRIADRVDCGLSEFSGLVEDLRQQGILIKKSSGRFQVVS